MALLSTTFIDVHLDPVILTTIYIGRHPDTSDIYYDDPNVSRDHCKISIRADGSAGIFESGSLNGTYLNNVRIPVNINGYKILPGDVITLRNPKFRHHDIHIVSTTILRGREPKLARKGAFRTDA